MFNTNTQIILDDCSQVIDELLVQLHQSNFVEGCHFVLTQFEDDMLPIAITLLTNDIVEDGACLELLEELAC